MNKSSICKKLAVLTTFVVILAVFTGCIGEDKEAEEEKEVIQLIVEQSYPKMGEEFSLPFTDECKQILESAGFKVVDEKATQYDYTLLVEIMGEALGTNYLTGGFLYTGARIDGSFSLSGPNTDITRLVHEEKPCPKFYIYSSRTSLPEKPSDAPFKFLHWEKHLFLLLYDIWGIEPILEAVDEKEIDVRESAAEALGEIGPDAKDAIPTLIDLLQDREVYVRKSAANALGEIGLHAKEAVPALITALGDEDSWVRVYTAEALGKIGAKEAVPALIGALEDEDNYVRRHATEALGEIGPDAKDAVPALIKLLEDEDKYVQGKAVTALKKITGEDLGEDPSKWQQWWEENK